MRRTAWLFSRARGAGCYIPVRSLPDGAAISFWTDHGRAIFAAECLLEFRQVRERANHTILTDWVRIALHHSALRFRTNLITAPLSPGNKELLLWRVTVNGGLRVGLLGFLESQESNLCAGKVANAFTQNQLAIVMNSWLDEITIELTHHT